MPTTWVDALLHKARQKGASPYPYQAAFILNNPFRRALSKPGRTVDSIGLTATWVPPGPQYLMMPNPFVAIHFCGHRLYKRAKMAKIIWSWTRTPQTRFNVGLHGLRPSKWPPNISMRELRRPDYAIPTTAYLRSC